MFKIGKIVGTAAAAFVAASMTWGAVKGNVCAGIDSLDSPDGFSMRPTKALIPSEGARIVLDKPTPLNEKAKNAVLGFYMCPVG